MDNGNVVVNGIYSVSITPFILPNHLYGFGKPHQKSAMIANLTVLVLDCQLYIIAMTYLKAKKRFYVVLVK